MPFIDSKDKFIKFLSTEYKSRNSQKPLSKKVISDAIGRIKRVEGQLGVDINEHMSNLEDFNLLCDFINKNYKKILLTENTTNNICHNYTYALRLYFKFTHKKNKNKLLIFNDARININ